MRPVHFSRVLHGGPTTVKFFNTPNLNTETKPPYLESQILILQFGEELGTVAHIYTVLKATSLPPFGILTL